MNEPGLTESKALVIGLEEEVKEKDRRDGCTNKLTAAFYDALAMNRQPTSTLYALYQGWVDTVEALRAAKVTGPIPDADIGARGKGPCGSLRRVRASGIQNLRT